MTCSINGRLATPFLGIECREGKKRYAGNKKDQFGAELSAQFKTRNQSAQKLFSRIQKLDLLEKPVLPMRDRYEEGLSNCDIPFQKQIKKLISEKVFEPNMLVVADTGHNIPMLATLSNELDVAAAIHIPNFNLERLGSAQRVLSQAQTWGDEINDNDKINSKDKKANTYYLGIDMHRVDSGITLDTTMLPTAEELKQAGVTKILYLAEEKAGTSSRSYIKQDVRRYFDDLEAKGIEISVRGVDQRGAR